MLKRRILIFLGIWIAALPYLGFPYAWKDILITVSGLLLLYISFILYKEYKELIEGTRDIDNFKENGYMVEREDVIVNDSTNNLSE
jgi:hypothetical protein